MMQWVVHSRMAVAGRGCLVSSLLIPLLIGEDTKDGFLGQLNFLGPIKNLIILDEKYIFARHLLWTKKGFFPLWKRKYCWHCLIRSSEGECHYCLVHKMSNIAHLQIHKRMRRKIGFYQTPPQINKVCKFNSPNYANSNCRVHSCSSSPFKRGGALWCTFQWLVKENFCNWTQKQEKMTRLCKTWMHHSCHEGSQNRLKRRVLQKRISAKDAAQTGLVQNIFSFLRATVDPNCNFRARLCFPGKRSNWGKKVRPTQNISSNYGLCLSALIFRLSHAGLCSAVSAVSFLAQAFNLLELRWFVGK